MRQLPIPEQSLSEADAIRLIRGFRPARSPRESGGQHQDALARTVESEVIPRLLQAHRRAAAVPPKPATAAKLPSAAQLAALVDMAINGTHESAATYVLALRRDGMKTETLLLDLITPAARHLGTQWEEDTCCFSDVTLGVLRLGHAVRALEEHAPPALGAPAALLAPVPGESHGLGLMILAQMFRRAGWSVDHARPTDIAGLSAIVQRQHVDIIGLSVVCDDRLEALAAQITTLRRASRNRSVFVLVGGPPFVVHPELALLAGADATATDAGHAVLQAQRLLAQADRA